MRIVLSIMLLVSFLGSPLTALDIKGRLTIHWFGHSCFYIECPDGTSILMDPFDDSVGYAIPLVTPDVVTISHDRFDHNCTTWARGNPLVITSSKRTLVNKTFIKGVETDLDERHGFVWGAKNIIFVIDVHGLRIAHFGGVGDVLTKKQLKRLGKIDIACIPVGGLYTVDAAGAEEIIEQVNPNIIIPMNYKTTVSTVNVEPIDAFLRLHSDIHNVTSIITTPDTFTDMEQGVYLLNYQYKDAAFFPKRDVYKKR
jgi:L-ascorbate metabolism protein UlaG (beta-lactamase superfamily)